MPMKMILFDRADIAGELKKSGVAVMLQAVGGDRRYAVADTPEVRDLMSNIKGHFDWSQVIATNHLCF